MSMIILKIGEGFLSKLHAILLFLEISLHMLWFYNFAGIDLFYACCLHFTAQFMILFNIFNSHNVIVWFLTT